MRIPESENEEKARTDDFEVLVEFAVLPIRHRHFGSIPVISPSEMFLLVSIRQSTVTTLHRSELLCRNKQKTRILYYS